MTSVENDRAAVAELVEGLRAGFGRADADRLKHLWADSGDLRYIAGERARPLRSREEIEAYYDEAVGPVAFVETAEITDLTVDVSGDLGYATCQFHYAGRESVRDSPFSVQIRVTLLACRRHGRWGVVHYHESTPGPL